MGENGGERPDGFDFQTVPGEELGLDSAVNQAIGAASACWEHLDRAGVFDSDRARAVSERLKDFVIDWALGRGPMLGLATTRQLIDELAARAELAHVGGQDWPDYQSTTYPTREVVRVTDRVGP